MCAGEGIVAAVVCLDLLDALALLHIGGGVVDVWARHVVEDEVECGGERVEYDLGEAEE